MRFGVVGASGFVIDVSAYVALQAAGFDHRAARCIAFVPAATSNWILNRYWTFRDRKRVAPTRQWGLFVTASLAGMTVNAGTYAALTTWNTWFDAHRLIALIAGVALGACVNFTLANHVVYRRT